MNLNFGYQTTSEFLKETLIFKMCFPLLKKPNSLVNVRISGLNFVPKFQTHEMKIMNFK